MAAVSSSPIVAAPPTSAASLSKQKAGRVFATELFELYVGRVVRRAIVSQYVDQGHQVLDDEIRLIAEAEDKLRRHLEERVPEWNMAWRLAKMVIVHHLRSLARERLEAHDLDDETRDEALEAVYRDDFERIFPKSWLDS